MGWAAARKLRRSIPGFARVLAVELLCSARAFDFRKPLVPSVTGQAVYEIVRRYADAVASGLPDTWTTPQIEGVAGAIMRGEIAEAAHGAVGELR